MTALKLIELNNEFYRMNAESFSQTRHASWPGWDQLCAHLPPPRSVLDVACGNMRFKAFLDERYGAGTYEYHALDSCPSLIPDKLRSAFQEIDILTALTKAESLDDLVLAPQCDFVVSFGFLHHVPTIDARLDLLDYLVSKVVPGGCVAVSFWQFARDTRMRDKAKATTERGQVDLGILLDEGDYLIGWNGLPGIYRYCHSYTDDEIDRFVAYLQDKAVVENRFRSDGRTGELNSYLLLHI